LIKLIKASNLWEEDETSDIVKEVKNVTENCDICKQYKRSPPTPIVSCSLSSHFNEAVAMDLIEIKGKFVLHLIDMFSRYSAACSRNTKGQEAITDGILKIWITYFGKPAKFLADNGGEFANETYIDMCAAFSIEIMKTSAESPWSNGLAERHNGVLKLSILKTVEESGCSLDTAVAWSTSAKNTLGNNLGYSANTIVFGRNPSFPSVISDNITALTAEDISRIVEENLYAMRAAREAYIEAESSEKIKRALTHNIRTSCEEHYEQGDKVFFKRNDSKRWYGPGTVIGQDGKQILVRNGSQMVRVHVTRINHVGKELHQDTNNTNSDSTNVNQDDSQLDIEEEHVTNELVTDNITEEMVESETEQNKTSEKENEGNIETEDTEKGIEKVPITDKVVHPKVKTHILYKLNNDENWRKGYVHSRAGKIHGKYESHFNIQNDDDGKIEPYDFNDKVQEWEPVPNEILITTQDKNAIMTAKQQEVENWKKNDVFEEVQFVNQNLITTRWVITTKEKDSVITTKARLVARGFEDEGIDKGKTDSPTCSRESLSLIQSLLAMKKWSCQAIDIKTAFLQGNPLEREVYLKPPKEFQSDNHVWKLKKAVYGLNEASRAWYNRVESEFKKVGLTKCKYDEALFYKKDHKGKLLGAIAIHVDDFIYGGCKEFLDTIEEMKSVFEIGTETSTPIKFLGMNIVQNEDCTISFHQNDYLKDLHTERNQLNGDKYRNLTTEEQRDFRGMVGQLNWVASRTDPIIAFDVCQLSTKLSQATVEDYHYAIKVTKKALNGSTLHYCSLEPPVFLLAYSDASYANLPDGSSQGGYVVFLADKSERVSPITWTSRKLRRVCRSTITAETMATLDAIDVCAWLFHMFRDVFDVEILPTVIRTDNKSSYQAINSTTSVEEKRLRVDIAAVRECIRNQEVCIEWVSKENQLADVLTKQGADSTKLAQVLRQCHT
jgi:transposase InsO family protein